MRLSLRGRRVPRTKTIRPAEPYLVAGADEARRLGHDYIGTEHILGVVIRDPESPGLALLARLGVSAPAAERALARWLPSASRPAKIDAEALAHLGIDVEVVRRRLEQTFGPGALERSPASCLGISPRLKLALAHALDASGSGPLTDEHLLLGMLSVPDSVAARVLGGLGVSKEAVEAIVGRTAA